MEKDYVLKPIEALEVWHFTEESLKKPMPDWIYVEKLKGGGYCASTDGGIILLSDDDVWFVLNPSISDAVNVIPEVLAYYPEQFFALYEPTKENHA